MAPDLQPSEHRRHPRALVGRPIQFQNRGQTLVGLLWEISEGGARLQSTAPLRRGERVELRLPFDQWSGSWGTFEVAGKVVRGGAAGGGAGGDSQTAVSFARRRLLPRHVLLLKDFICRSQLGR
jgi:hypothetical protein